MILTKPVSVSKNVPTVFTLNKSDLASHSLVMADADFSIVSNWSRVVLIYKSSEGQSEKVIFRTDSIDNLVNGEFLVSDKAHDIFEIDRIDIYDFDNAHLSIHSANLIAADFIVDMTP